MQVLVFAAPSISRIANELVAARQQQNHPFGGVETFNGFWFVARLCRHLIIASFWEEPSAISGNAFQLSQEQLSEKADLHPNYLGRVERGEEHVSLIALRRIAAALGVRVRELVRDI